MRGGVEFMKRIIAIVSVLFLIALSPFAFVGCAGETVDGIKITRKKYDKTVSYDNYTTDATYYDLTFSCTVKNTTKEDLQFKIMFSARYSGVFGKEETETQLIELKAGEKKKLEYTRKKTGDQIYLKSIRVVAVEPLGTESLT